MRIAWLRFPGRFDDSAVPGSEPGNRGQQTRTWAWRYRGQVVQPRLRPCRRTWAAGIAVRFAAARAQPGVARYSSSNSCEAGGIGGRVTTGVRARGGTVGSGA